MKTLGFLTKYHHTSWACQQSGYVWVSGTNLTSHHFPSEWGFCRWTEDTPRETDVFGLGAQIKHTDTCLARGCPGQPRRQFVIFPHKGWVTQTSLPWVAELGYMKGTIDPKGAVQLLAIGSESLSKLLWVQTALHCPHRHLHQANCTLVTSQLCTDDTCQFNSSTWLLAHS